MQNPRIRIDENGDEFLVQGGQAAKIWRDPFTYVFPVFSAVAAGAQATQQLTIQSDADFEWVYGAYQYSLAFAAFTESTRPIPNSSVVIQDQGSGRQLSNAAVPVENLFGMPWQPFELPLSKVFKANSTLAAILTNNDAAVATGRLYLSLIGYKIFYYS